MSKRLPAALTAAALCSLFGALQAQTTDAPDATGQQRYQQPTPQIEPAPGPAISTPTESLVPMNSETTPQNRSDVQAQTRAAMRAGQIPRGELSTPDQDKGGERALTPYERALPPSSY